MVNKMANLKGNLGLKSSSLAPTACKLSTQYLVLDHMTNHYDKISKAKSAIDNKPPKSMITSQKMRDRRTRERVTSPHRSRPATSMSHTYGYTGNEDLEEYQDLFNEEPEDEEGRLVQSIMKTTLKNKSNGSNDATFNSKTQTVSQSSDFGYKIENGYSGVQLAGGEHQRFKTQRPLSARSARSVTSNNGLTRVPITSHDQKRITYNGDVLEKRSYCFTEPEKPFTPRTLKSNHQSRLKNSKSYNAPKNQSGKQNSREFAPALEQRKDRETHVRPQPRPQPRQRTRSGQSDQFGSTIPTNKLSETMLMDITLQSRDGRFQQEEKRDVPPLAISMDTDHFKWLQEQASKAQVRAKHSTKLKPGLQPTDPNVDGIENNEEESPLNLSHSIRLEMLKKEEEQKYLAFAKEVTDDVITRGISTDKVLHRVFENHIERRKGDLDEARMRETIKDLKRDLGLRDASVERKESHTVNFVQTDKKEPSISGSVHSDKGSHSSKNEMTNGFHTNSNMTMTMESTSTMKFGQTGDLFSTIHSDAPERELSDGEIIDESEREMNKENDNDENELTATQVLKEYQMNLTAKDANGELNGELSSDIGNGVFNSITQEVSESDRPATGERRLDQESSTENGRTTTELSSTVNGTGIVTDSFSKPSNSQDFSTLNGSGSRSRVRNKRREKLSKSSSGSVESSSTKEEPSSNSVLKSSRTASVETGSEKETMSESERPARKPRRGKGVRGQVEEASEVQESQGEDGKSTVKSEGSINGEDYAGDYEDDYEDGSHDEETHRTSDDDF